MVPLRDDVVGFALTLYVTCPLPLPLLPAVIVIQEALLDAVHAQPLAALTVTFPVAAPDPSVALTGERTNVQTAPSCDTVKLRPAIVRVPVRGVVLVLAVTE